MSAPEHAAAPSSRAARTADADKAAAKKANALAEAHDLTREQASALLARHPGDPDLLEAAAEKILKPEDDPGPDTGPPRD